MFDFYFILKVPNWTDVVQVIASVIAAVGVVAALWNIRSENRRVQEQINSLATLAKESDARLKAMTKDIMPLFTSEQENGFSAPNELGFRFKNIGGDAHEVEFTSPRFHVLNPYTISIVKRGERRSYRIEFVDKISPIYSGSEKNKYKDSMGFKYEQEVIIDHGKPLMGDPKFIH